MFIKIFTASTSIFSRSKSNNTDTLQELSFFLWCDLSSHVLIVLYHFYIGIIKKINIKRCLSSRPTKKHKKIKYLEMFFAMGWIAIGKTYNFWQKHGDTLVCRLLYILRLAKSWVQIPAREMIFSEFDCWLKRYLFLYLFSFACKAP